MHKLAKGLKKKKKQKKGKKGAEEDEFDPEELERYRKERAEAQQKAAEAGEAAGAGSDEWKKFEALTAGVDSILKKTQGDLDRIKSTSFFQRKAPLDDKKKATEEAALTESRRQAKKWVGFDKDGNPIGGSDDEDEEVEQGGSKKGTEYKSPVFEENFFDLPEDEDDQEDSAEEDIFDTTYVDVLQNIDVQLAYIPESPTEQETGDDPFDTTSADKVLKTVDKKGNKLVSLGNAVEVLSGRIDHVSTCKIGRPRKSQRGTEDLLLGEFEEGAEPQEVVSNVAPEPAETSKTLLDDDSDLPDVPVDLAKLPPALPKSVTPDIEDNHTKKTEIAPLDISEFEVLKEKTILEEIPDLDDAEFDLSAVSVEPVLLEEADDPFGAKEPEEGIGDFQTEIIEASFEAATFVDEEDPFDTTFADNLLPGKAELKFIEKELEELPVSEVSISLTDPAGLHRDYETGLIKEESEEGEDNFGGSLEPAKKDLLGGSVTDLGQLTDEPIAPEEEIIYVDPFDTSSVQELPPGKTELKFLEKELLGETPAVTVDAEDSLFDDEFDPRKDEKAPKVAPKRPAPPVKPNFQVNFEEEEKLEENDSVKQAGRNRKFSRPENLGLNPAKNVAFELPTPSQRPDLLKTSEEEKAIPSKPLTPYYSQKSLEESLPEAEVEEAEVDPFDTSFVSKVTPGKTELKLIESELLKQETKLPHSLSDHDFDPRAEASTQRRRFSEFSVVTARPKDLNVNNVETSKTRGRKPIATRQESLLDAEVEVNAKALTPRVESKVREEDEELSYRDPFDTSIAANLPPGKAELKLLENELSQVREPSQLPVKPVVPARSNVQVVPPVLEEEQDFDPRAGETADILSLGEQDSGAKVLTPYLDKEPSFGEDIDPFDTSFATIGPGKTELKLLESEFMEK